MPSLASFDVYPKTLKEFRQRTFAGALVSIVCAATISLLAGIEIADFLQVKTDDHLFVDTTRGQELRINMNITFPALPCSVFSLDTLDVSGNHADDLMRHISKTRLDAAGRALDPLPGSRGPAGLSSGGRRLLSGDSDNVPAAAAMRLSQPNTLLSKLLAELMPDVFEDKEAIAELRKHVGEGCRVTGFSWVKRVAGNFHFALTEEDQHTLLTVFHDRESLNVSHVIHELSFGDPYPGMVNPLDGMVKSLSTGSGYFQYYLKIVPTLYEDIRGNFVHTNQYSFTELFRTTREIDKLPAVYFHYEISPIMAKFSQRRRSFGSFLTGLCAIVGGVFTVAGMIDACIHRTMKLVAPGHLDK